MLFVVFLDQTEPGLPGLMRLLRSMVVSTTVHGDVGCVCNSFTLFRQGKMKGGNSRSAVQRWNTRGRKVSPAYVLESRHFRANPRHPLPYGSLLKQNLFRA
jgi:hypothetical protein